MSRLAELVDAVLAMRRDLRRLALASAPTLSRSEVAELLGARETEAGAWLDEARHRDLVADTPSRERRYSGPRVRQALEAPVVATTPRGRKDNVYQLPR